MEPFQIVAIVVSLALTVVAVVLVTQAVRAILAVVRTGQPSTPRTANPAGRTVTMVKETFLHTRMLQWSVVGVMHWFVYFAFIVLGAAVFTAYFQLFDPEFQLPVIGHFFLYEWLGEVLGVLGTIGIVYLAYYRQKHHPRREGRDSRFYRSTMWQAYFVEVMALLEGSAILFIRGAEYNLGKLLHPTGEDADHYTRFHFPVSGFFGDVLYPDSEDSLRTIIFAVAMVKIVLAMIWLIVIARNLTMGVAWHRFTAWFNIWFKREPSGRTALGAMKPLTSGGKAITLDDIDDLDEDSLLGVGSVEDFSWKNILDFTTCTECGRCQSQCPAWNTEKPLNPKLLITALRDATYAKAPYTQAVQAGGEEAGAKLLEGNDTLTREAERPLVGNVPEGEWFYNPESGAAVIDAEVLWNCTSCGACVQQCPVDIEHVDHIMDMRRYAVLVESNFPTQLNGLFKGLENKGNPWNMSTTARLDWTKGLDFEVKVVGESIESLDEVDWLFWVGCAGAYEDRAKKTTRAVAELLDMAGVSFGVLGNGETCTGDPARRAGNEFVFQGLAQQNVETFKEFKVKKVVSTCAHCFNTLKNEYQEFGVELEVVHHTQLLNRLVREGKLTPVKGGEGAHKRSITYHDPCYIGRHNDVYTPPRELLEILPGADFVEMERNSERSFCCGAGGARMWMEENIGSRINVNRTIEAVGTGADQIAVGCPFCRVMLSDGLTAQQAKGEAREEVEVLDVAQMLLASVKGEVATKLKPGAGAAGAAAPAKGAESTDVEAKAATAEEKVDETPGAAAVAEEPEVSEPDAKVADDASTAPGPVAKAAGGGSSLFDSPEDAPEPEPATADADASVAEEAKAATPASSGGSLFDLGGDAEPEAKAAPAKEAAPAEAAPEAEVEAAPAEDAEPAPAKAQDTDLGSGGSLFDLGGDAEPEAKAAPAEERTEPAPAVEDEPSADAQPAKAEPEKAESEKAAETTGPDEAEPAEAEPAKDETAGAEPDLASGGSLFDIPSTPAPAAAAAPAPAATEEPEAATESTEEAAKEPEEPAATATTESTAEPEAEPEAGAQDAAPAELDLSAGGSLFDIPSTPAPAPKAATPEAKAPEATAEEPADSKAVAEEPSAEAPAEQGDTTEPEPAAADAKAGADTDAGQAASAEPAGEQPAAEATAQPEPAAEPAARTVRRRKPGSAGSLFDVAAPAAAIEPEAAKASQPTETPTEAEAAADPEPVEDTATDTESDAEQPDATEPDATEESPEPEASVTPAEAEPEVAPKAAPAPLAEIPEGGSLFDIVAPEPVAPEPVAAAPAEPEVAADAEASPAADAEPEAAANAEPEAAADPEPEASADAQPEAAADAEPEASADPEPEAEPATEPEPAAAPAAEVEPEPELTPAQAVSAAATAAASDEPAARAEPDAEAEPEAGVPESAEPPAEEQAQADEAAADAEPEVRADAEAEAELDAVAEPDADAPEAETETEAGADTGARPASSGASHTPRTDVTIDEAGSLFDL